MESNSFFKKMVISLSDMDLKNLEFLRHYWGSSTNSSAIGVVLNRVAYEVKQDLLRSGLPENATLDEAIKIGNQRLEAISKRRNEQS